MTDVIKHSETLEYRKRGDTHTTGTSYEPVLVACPACGYDFKGGVNRVHHIATHSPGDFGL